LFLNLFSVWFMPCRAFGGNLKQRQKERVSVRLYRQLEILMAESNEVYGEYIPLTKEYVVLITVLCFTFGLRFDLGLVITTMAWGTPTSMLMVLACFLCRITTFENRLWRLRFQIQRLSNGTKKGKQRSRSLSQIKFRYGKFGWYSWEVLGFMLISIAEYLTAALLL